MWRSSRGQTCTAGLLLVARRPNLAPKQPQTGPTAIHEYCIWKTQLILHNKSPFSLLWPSISALYLFKRYCLWRISMERSTLTLVMSLIGFYFSCSIIFIKQQVAAEYIQRFMNTLVSLAQGVLHCEHLRCGMLLTCSSTKSCTLGA